MKKGFITTWNLGYPGCCVWFGCRKPPLKNSKFCKEHGEKWVSITVVDKP